MHTFLLPHRRDRGSMRLRLSSHTPCLCTNMLLSLRLVHEQLNSLFLVLHNCSFTAVHVMGHSMAWNEAWHLDCSQRPKRNPTSPQDLILGLYIAPELCWLLQACKFKKSSWCRWIAETSTTLKNTTLSCTAPSTPYVKQWNQEKEILKTSV